MATYTPNPSMMKLKAKPGMDEGPTAEEVQAGLTDMANTFMGLWQERAAADPGERNDLISMLAHGETTRDMIHRPLEFLGNIMLLIVGGNDTTRNSISDRKSVV